MTNQYNHDWTEKEINFIRNNCKIMPYKEIVKHLDNRTLASTYSKVYKLGIKSGRKGFQKGIKMWKLRKKDYKRIKNSGSFTKESRKNLIIPWNKGLTKEDNFKLKSNRKGRTFEEIYGLNKARQLKENHSKILKEKYKKGEIKLHNRKGFKHSSETKAKISKVSKDYWKTPEYREKYFKTRNTSKFKQILRENRAKQVLPYKDTKIEVKIQNFLKELGIDFFTHNYIKDIDHKYQCDILIPSMKMVIECDGMYWHKYPIGRDIDHIRTKELLDKGFKVLRLWEQDIINMSLKKFNYLLEVNNE